MKPRLSAVVMTHPSRVQHARRLVDAHQDLSIDVVLDPDPDGPPTPIRTAKRAWASVSNGCTHHLVLQDDISAVSNLKGQLESAVAALPHNPICLFTEWASKTAQSVRIGVLQGYTLVEVLDELHTAQAIVLPVKMAEEFSSYLDALGDIDPSQLDSDLIFTFIRSKNYTPYVTAPNLVEHLELPSLLGNDFLRGPRRSPCFDPSFEVDRWLAQPASSLHIVPHLSTDGRSYCYLRTADGWRTRQTVDFLSESAPLSHLLAIFSAEMSNLEDVAEVRRYAAEPLVFQIWITVVVSGMIAREAKGRACPSNIQLSGAITKLAWSTLVPGALRRTLPEEASRRLSTNLDRMLQRALEENVVQSSPEWLSQVY